MTDMRRTAGTMQGIMLLLPATLVVMGIIVLVPVLPAMAAHFARLPHADIRVGVVLTTPALMVVLFAGLAGLLADLLGRRRLLIASMVVYAAAGVLPFFLESFWPILASRVVVGMCEAVVITTSTAMIGDYFAGPERDKWLGYQVAVASAGATVLILVGGILGGLFGWQGPFLVYILPLPFAAGVAWLLWEVVPPASCGEQAGSPSWSGFPGSAFAAICAVTLFGSYLFYLTQVEISFSLARLGVTDPQRAGILISIASLGVIVGSIVFKRVSTQPVARLLAINLAIVGVTLVGMGVARTVGVLVPVAFLNEAGTAMILSTLLTWAVRTLPFRHRGRGTGIWQATFAVGQFLVSITVPMINVLTGGLSASLVLIGAVAICAAMCAVLLARGTGRRRTLVRAGRTSMPATVSPPRVPAPRNGPGPA